MKKAVHGFGWGTQAQRIAAYERIELEARARAHQPHATAEAEQLVRLAEAAFALRCMELSREMELGA